MNENIQILIVDDEPANILLLEKILRTHGYKNIITTSDPVESVELYKNNNVELILLDINMPKMSGYEVLEELRKSPGFSNSKVIASSGDISKREINQALEAGFYDYITKPMKMQNILEIVEKALSGDDKHV